MRFDTADLVLSYDNTRVFPLLALDVGDPVDDRGWVYKPVLARIPLSVAPPTPSPGFVVHDTRAKRVVIEFHAMRVWRFADEDEVRIEGQQLIAVREPEAG